MEKRKSGKGKIKKGAPKGVSAGRRRKTEVHVREGKSMTTSELVQWYETKMEKWQKTGLRLTRRAVAAESKAVNFREQMRSRGIRIGELIKAGKDSAEEIKRLKKENKVREENKAHEVASTRIKELERRLERAAEEKTFVEGRLAGVQVDQAEYLRQLGQAKKIVFGFLMPWAVVTSPEEVVSVVKEVLEVAGLKIAQGDLENFMAELYKEMAAMMRQSTPEGNPEGEVLPMLDAIRDKFVSWTSKCFV